MRSLLDQLLNVCSHWSRFGGGPFGLVVVLLLRLLGPATGTGSGTGFSCSGGEVGTVLANFKLLLPVLELTLSPGDSLCCFMAEVHGSSEEVRFLAPPPLPQLSVDETSDCS